MRGVQVLGRWWITLVALTAIPVGAALWYLASPLFISKTVNEGLPQAVAQPPNQVHDTAGALSPVKRGRLRDGDSFHKGSGQAVVYRLPDGAYTLRLEDLNVTNGPDLYVVLSPNANPTSAAEVTAPGYLEVATLKGNLGNQNYPLPAGVDLAPLKSLVIFCKQFRVVFSVAPLDAAG